MNVLTCDISGLLIIEPKVFGDVRGFFLDRRPSIGLAFAIFEVVECGIERHWIVNHKARTQLVALMRR